MKKFGIILAVCVLIFAWILLRSNRDAEPARSPMQPMIPPSTMAHPSKISSAEQPQESVMPTAEEERAHKMGVVHTAVRKKPGEPLNPPPIPTSVPAPREPRMGWAKGEITIGDHFLRPRNAFGSFPRLQVNPSESIHVRMTWPRAEPGAPVAIEVVAAGHLEGGASSRLEHVGADGSVKFNYTANDRPGLCQVVMRSGFDETTLNFWVVTGDAERDGPHIVP